MQGYYQKMAEDYRAKFLELEQEHLLLKQTHDLDIVKLAKQHSEEQAMLQEKMHY